MTQICSLTCNLNSTNTIKSNLTIIIDYPCFWSSSYTQFSLSAQAFGQNQNNNGNNQLYQENKQISSLIQVKSNYYCKIESCQLATWVNNLCNQPFVQSFYNYSSDSNWLNTSIVTSSTRLPLSSCIICQTNASGQSIQLDNNLTYSVYCNNISPRSPLLVNQTQSLVQSPGSDNPSYLTLKLSEYFTGLSDPYVCTYTICRAIQSSNHQNTSWITGSITTSPIVNDVCLFSITTTNTQSLQDLALYVINSGENVTHAVSSAISFEVKDVCKFLSVTNQTNLTTYTFYESLNNTTNINVLQNNFTFEWPYNIQQIDMSLYFKRPLTTCVFQTCALLQSGAQPCHNTVLTQISGNSYELKVNATMVYNASQSCYYQCTIADGVSTVKSQNFDIKVVSACSLASTYTETQPTNLALSQQVNIQNSFSQSWIYSSFVAVKTNYSCQISSCSLLSYSSSCQNILTESWITQSSSNTALSATINTISAQPNTQFCIECSSLNLYLQVPVNETVILNNKINIGICGILQPKANSSANVINYIQYQGTENNYNTFLTISNFFTIPLTNFCIYNSCSIVAKTNASSLFWITGFVYNTTDCSFNLNTSFIQSSTSIQLNLISTTINQINVINDKISISIIDYCYIPTNYQYGNLSLPNLHQQVFLDGTLNQVNQSVNMNDYIFTNRSYFNFTSCNIYIQNTMNPCPQATLTKTSGVCTNCSTCDCNIYNLTRRTISIQNQTQCMIKCLLHDNQTYINTNPFFVNVDYSCNQSYAFHEIQQPVLALSQKKYSTDQYIFVKNWVYSEFFQIISGYSCSIQSSNFLSTNSNCNQAFSLNQTWLQPLTPSPTSIATNITTTSGSGQNYSFCIQFQFNSGQIYRMINTIEIGICAIKINKTLNSNLSELIILQYPGSPLVFNYTLNFQDYFDQPIQYPCLYSSCQIFNSSFGNFSWITQTYFTNDNCTFTVQTQNIQYIKDAYLTLLPPSLPSYQNQITIQSSPIQINVSDVCMYLKYYSVIDNKQKPLIKYNMSYLQYFGVNFSFPDQLKVSDYFSPPLSRCEYLSCNIVDQSNQTPNWIFNITLSDKICSWQIDTFITTNITQLKFKLTPKLTSGNSLEVQMNFTVDESCSKANIQLAQNLPLPDESQASDYQMIGSIPRLIVVVKLNLTKTYEVNITNRFINSMSQYCPITQYKIDKVVNYYTGYNIDDWQKLFRIDEQNGTLTFLDFSNLPTYLIYIKALNAYGAFGGQQDYLIARWTNENPIIVELPKDELTQVVIQKNISVPVANQSLIIPQIDQPSIQIQDTKNLSAKITQVSNFGDFEITFNSSIQFKGINISHFNTSNTQINILRDPNLQSDQIQPNLNFTWKVVSLTSTKLSFKIIFDNPYSVSNGIKQDQLQIIFYGSQYLLWSENLQKFLHEDYWQLTCNIKPLMPESKSTQTFLESATAGSEGFKFFFVFGLAVNAISEGQSQLMFGLMRTLQLSLHLPILQTVVPPNVAAFFKTIIPVVTFDLLDMFWDWKENPQVLKFDVEGQEKISQNVLPQLRDLGYQGRNTILNSSTLCIIIWFYYAKVLLVIILKLWIYATLNTFNAKKLLKFLIKGLFFDQILGLSIESYIEFNIAGILTLQKTLKTTNGEIVSQIMAFYMMGTSLIILPPLFTFIMTLSFDQLENISFKKRLKCLYEGIDPRSRYKRAYFLVYCLKRLVFVSIAFFMDQERFNSMQLISVIIINILSMIYVLSAKAFEKKLYNLIDSLNEFLNSIIAIHMFCFAYWSDKPEIKILIGWSMIGFVGILLILNLGPILLNNGKTLKLILIKYFKIVQRLCLQLKIIIKRCVGKSQNNQDSVQQLINSEKEKLQQEIQNAEKENKKLLAKELGLIIQESLHNEYIQKQNEQERNFRKQKYEDQRNEIISQLNDKKQPQKNEKLLNNQLSTDELLRETIRPALEQKKTYSETDIVNALSKNILPPQEFMKAIGIKVPELEEKYQLKLKKKFKMKQLISNPKQVINSMNLPIISEENKSKKQKKNTKYTLEQSLQVKEQQIAKENNQNNSFESDEQSLSISMEETPRFELTNLAEQNNEQQQLDLVKEKDKFLKENKQENMHRFQQKSQKIYPTNAFYEKSFSVYSCRKDKYLPTDQLTLATLEDLPFTFGEWEQTDYLFKIKDGENFRKFVANRFTALFEVDVRYQDWTKDYQGTERQMELKKSRIRETIAELRRLWIFESESDQVKLEKFKLVNKMMQNYYKKTKGKQSGEDIIKPATSPMLAYNLGVSDLASYFQIPRDQFELKKGNLK